MHSKIWCKTHRLRPPRLVYYVDSIDPTTGLVRHAAVWTRLTRQTALQTFVREYRDASLFFGPGSWYNLREAHRVESFIRPALDPAGQLATFQAPPVEVFEAPKPKKGALPKMRARPTTAPRAKAAARKTKRPSSRRRKDRDSPDDDDDIYDPPMNDDDYDDPLPQVVEEPGEADESSAWLDSGFLEQQPGEEVAPPPAPPSPPPEQNGLDYDGPQQLTIEPMRLRRVGEQYASRPFVSAAESAPPAPAHDPRLPPHLNGLHNGNGATDWPPMASGSGTSGPSAAPSPPPMVDQWADIDPMFQPSDDAVDPALANGDAMMYEMPEARTSEPPHSAPILPPHLQQHAWSPPAPEGDMQRASGASSGWR